MRKRYIQVAIWSFVAILCGVIWVVFHLKDGHEKPIRNHNAECMNLATALLHNNYLQSNRTKKLEQAVAMLRNGVVDKNPILLNARLIQAPYIYVEGVKYMIVIQYIDEGQIVKDIKIKNSSDKVIDLKIHEDICISQRSGYIEHRFQIPVFDNKELLAGVKDNNWRKTSICVTTEDLSGLLQGEWNVILLSDKEDVADTINIVGSSTR